MREFVEWIANAPEVPLAVRTRARVLVGLPRGDSCDYPDCEQHYRYIAERERDAIRLAVTTGGGRFGIPWEEVERELNSARRLLDTEPP